MPRADWLQRDLPDVWFVGQRSRAEQFGDGWYVPETIEHPARTPPDAAAEALRIFGEPGERWLDTMCGSGVTLVEGAKQGLELTGVEFQEKFAGIARANAEIAGGRTGILPQVVQGDARHLADLFPPASFNGGIIDPPYAEIRQDGGRHRWGQRGALGNYSGEPRIRSRAQRDPANLGNLKYADHLAAMQQIYGAYRLLIRPGGLLLIILKNYRKGRREVNLAGDTVQIAQAAGWEPHGQIKLVTSPVEIADGKPVIKPLVSGSQRRNARHEAEKDGIPQALIVGLTLLVFK